MEGLAHLHVRAAAGPLPDRGDDPAGPVEIRRLGPIGDGPTEECHRLPVEQYPGGAELNKSELAPYMRIPAGTPPIFLVHASDDPVAGVENSFVMYLALKRANVDAELHVYAQGGHGFGVRKSDFPCSAWTERCSAWLESQGLISTQK